MTPERIMRCESCGGLFFESRTLVHSEPHEPACPWCGADEGAVAVYIVDAGDTARQRPKDTVRVWVSDWPSRWPVKNPVVCVAVWGMKPAGYYGIRWAAEIRTAADWNGVLDRLEEVL